MNPDDVRHNAVNWEFGMLVAPEHFLRQERYYDAALLWNLRYVHSGFGLVGGGPRLPESEFGAVRNDPIVTISEDEQKLRISVTQCRGITVSGSLIEVSPDRPLHREFDKTELEGLRETRIYIVAPPHTNEIVDGAIDELNPQMQTERIRAYQLALQPHGEMAQHAIAVGRIRRSQHSTAYEKDPSFIPPCTSLASFSELTATWRRIVEQLTYLANRFIELHRAMQEYIELAQERGIDTNIDRDSLEFVKRVIPPIESCLYDCLDPVQSPAQFFGHIRKFLHGAAVTLDLNPPVQQYFDALKNAGETDFIPLIEQQKQLLKSSRRWRMEDDLSVEVRFAQNSLRSLQILERALEGKYIDFRLSPTLDAMNFVFDRGGSALYKLAAKPARLQGFGEEMTFYFAGLRLEGREKYRAVVTGARDAELPLGTQIPIEIRINEGAGYRRAPINGAAEARLASQKNFEFDFDAPDVATVTDLRIAVPAHFGIQTALLFVRHRFYAQDTGQSKQPETARRPASYPDAGQLPVEPRPTYPDAPSQGAPAFRPPLQPPSANPAHPLAPWERRTDRSAPPRPGESVEPAPSPRRRRLE
jgi:hypothetical protein